MELETQVIENIKRLKLNIGQICEAIESRSGDEKEVILQTAGMSIVQANVVQLMFMELSFEAAKNDERLPLRLFKEKYNEFIDEMIAKEEQFYNENEMVPE